jgi:hypothetical protein
MYTIEIPFSDKFPRMGDIAFTHALFDLSYSGLSDAISDFANITAQSLLRFEKTRINHVMISLGSNSFLHTRPGKGYEVETWANLWDGANPVVYRNPHFTGHEISKIMDSVAKCNNSRYSLGSPLNFFRKNNIHNSKKGTNYTDHAYCSSFVAHIFETAGIDLTDRFNVLPIDLYKVCQDWEDVSLIYEPYLGKKSAENKDPGPMKHYESISEMNSQSEKSQIEGEIRREKIRSVTDTVLRQMTEEVENFRNSTNATIKK